MYLYKSYNASGKVKCILALAVGLMTAAAAAPSRPNLVYILLDDLDVLLGSEVMLKQTHALLSSRGARFTHFLTHSPKCTPSRTGQYAGRNYQNVRVSGDPTGKTKGKGLDELSLFDDDALFPQLHAAGYLTSVVGKLHNHQFKYFCNTKSGNNTTPFSHVSTQCSVCGGYFKGEYIHKAINDTTTRVDNSVNVTDWSAYSHAQFGNRSAAFVKQAVEMNRPFFAYIGTTGPHLPCIPAPWHVPTVAAWTNVTAPRLATFNAHMPTHHPTIAALPDLTPAGVKIVDQQFRDRLGTLLSVDDLVAGVIHNLEQLGVLDNTFILFSSDHGYHLGNYRLPMEKMWPYETDIRIPFYIAGPGIDPGQQPDVMGVNIDIAPTLLDLAGIKKPNQMDGHSLLPLIMGSAASKAKATASWRTKTIIAFAEGNFQYWGGVDVPAFPNAAAFGQKGHCGPANLEGSHVVGWTGGCVSGLYNTELPNGPRHMGGANYTFNNPKNNWRMLRVTNATDNIAYIQWDHAFKFDTVDFHAYFDVNADPLEQTNLWPTLSVGKQDGLQRELAELFSCHGTESTPSNCP